MCDLQFKCSLCPDVFMLSSVLSDDLTGLQRQTLPHSTTQRTQYHCPEMGMGDVVSEEGRGALQTQIYRFSLFLQLEISYRFDQIYGTHWL